MLNVSTLPNAPILPSDYLQCLGFAEYTTYFGEVVAEVAITFNMTPWIIASMVITSLLQTATIMSFAHHWVKEINSKSNIHTFRKILLTWSLVLYFGHLSFAANRGFMSKFNIFFIYHFEPEFVLGVFLALSAAQLFRMESSDTFNLHQTIDKLSWFSYFCFVFLNSFLIAATLFSRVIILVMSNLGAAFRVNAIQFFSDVGMAITSILNVKHGQKLTPVRILTALATNVHLIESITVTFIYCLSHSTALIIHFIDIPVTHLLLLLTMVYAN